MDKFTHRQHWGVINTWSGIVNMVIYNKTMGDYTVIVSQSHSKIVKCAEDIFDYMFCGPNISTLVHKNK